MFPIPHCIIFLKEVITTDEMLLLLLTQTGKVGYFKLSLLVESRMAVIPSPYRSFGQFGLIIHCFNHFYPLIIPVALSVRTVRTIDCRPGGGGGRVLSRGSVWNGS
jgi:hypothetical protein